MGRRGRKNRSRRGLTLKGKILLVFFLVFLILLITGTLLLTLPQFKLQQVNINDLVKLEKQQILDIAGFQLDKNIWTQKFGKAEKEIEKLKAVKNATISVKLPDNINIHIEERKETYQLKTEGGYYVIDEQGYLLKKIEKKTKIPEIFGIEANIENDTRLEETELTKLETINKIYNTAKVLNMDGLISEINLESTGFNINFASSKKRAHFENTNSLMNSMQFVREILYSQEEKGIAADIYATEEGARVKPR